MNPEQFIAHWKDNPLTERAGAQAWFCDLCDLLDVDKPRDLDNYCFERGAKKTQGGDGWADVWKRGCFGWENKKPGRDLDAALKQLTDYALNLENPPLLVVSDRERIVIHTAFTGYPDEPRDIRLADLIDPHQREILRWVFTDPEQLKPGKSFKAITEAAAARFADLAARMRARADSTPLIHRSQRVAHFLVQCLFCLFAEDERLLPEHLFADVLKNAGGDVEKARKRLSTLFTAMRNPSGEYGDHDIAWFNGGLFQVIDIPPLDGSDLAELHAAARDLDWRDIDPTIFGTLFERGLDPQARAPLGAHYTDVETIGKLIDPVVTQPLLREWDAAKALIQAGQGKGERTKAYKQARDAYQRFLLRLHDFRVLDAACGSGNFLYLALKALRDLEKRAQVDARDLGIEQPQVLLQTGPHNVLGLEINEYAAELARVTVWIGDIQWCRRNGYPHATDPILQALDGIEHRDALLTFSPRLAGEGAGVRVTEAEWPTADVIVGNPPFLGGSKKRGHLGDATFNALNAVYGDRVPGGADLVCYWFEKARAHIVAGKCHAAGLVATNSIRGGANRKVLERIVAATLLPSDTGEHHGQHHLRHAQIHSHPQGVRHSGGSGGSHRGSLPGGASGGGAGDQERPAGIGIPADHQAGRHDDGRDRRGSDAGEAAVAPLRIFTAWSDEPWINEDAAVRVSLVCFGSNAGQTLLNGQPVSVIHADLTGEPLGGTTGSVDLTQAKPLPENFGTCFMGASKKAPFDIPGELARSWLNLPNPHQRGNAEVLRPLWNGLDLTRRPRDTWIIDFGADLSEADAALFERPFEFVVEHVKPVASKNRDAVVARNWWRHARPRIDMRTALKPIHRYIATPHVSKHRLFVWLDRSVLSDQMLLVTARADDATFGILHSRFHELWSLRLCTWLGKGNDPRYTPTTTFETFPFPAGLTPADTRPVGAQPPGRRTEAIPAGLSPGVAERARLPQMMAMVPDLADPARLLVAEVIAQAAFDLNRLREAWLNPPVWVDWVITPEEEHAGFPRRPVAKPGHEADLKQRTLTNLYNTRPAWLAMAHEKLDQAVASAYGWDDYTPDMADEEVLRRLLALNRARTEQEDKP